MRVFYEAIELRKLGGLCSVHTEPPKFTFKLCYRKLRGSVVSCEDNKTMTVSHPKNFLDIIYIAS